MISTLSIAVIIETNIAGFAPGKCVKINIDSFAKTISFLLFCITRQQNISEKCDDTRDFHVPERIFVSIKGL